MFAMYCCTCLQLGVHNATFDSSKQTLRIFRASNGRRQTNCHPYSNELTCNCTTLWHSTMISDHSNLLSQLPCIMWLAIYKPRKFSLSWITNWVCFVQTFNSLSILFSSFFTFYEKIRVYFIVVNDISDLHYTWGSIDDNIAHRGTKADHCSSQDLQVLLLILLSATGWQTFVEVSWWQQQRLCCQRHLVAEQGCVYSVFTYELFKRICQRKIKWKKSFSWLSRLLFLFFSLKK